MTSPALIVLSLALVCSIFGTASEQVADHDRRRAVRNMEQNHGLIYDNLDNIDINMKTRTNIDNHIKELSIDNNEYKVKNKTVAIDDIYTDYRNRKTNFNDDRIFSGITMRQYNFNDTIIKKRVKREDDAEKCEAFALSQNEGRITHPHDKMSKDKLYYSDTNCVYVIKASEGEVIKLTFVDVFHIEDHPDCIYDYLEIRDGQQGYAKLLGKLCGQTFPPQIISSGPYLWLKFHSDKTIEYEGFHISVNIEKSSTSHSIPAACNKTLTGWSGVIDTKDIDPDCKSGSLNQALDVLWKIEAPENTKIYLNFTSYTLDKPNECEENVVQVYGYVLEFDAHLAHYCGSMANSVTTKVEDGKNGKFDPGNIMYVRMYNSKTAKGSSFNATFTAFRSLDPNNDEKCKETEFDCEDNTCIAMELKCDRYAHCRLKADEDPELCKGETESTISQPHIMVILIIFSLILSGMSFVFLFKCIRKLYQDSKIIKEHISQSCEDRLDTLISDGRFPLDAKKLQRDSEPRASLERENHTNEMFKQQRHFSQRKSSSIDSDFIQETHLDIEEEHWRREVDNVPIAAQDIKIERNGRTRQSDARKREESIRSKTKENDERREKKEIRDASVGAPDTKESGCQTRESLFQTETAPSSDGSGSNSRGFSTFGYSGATIARPSPPAPTTNTSQITIELLRQVPTHQDSAKSQKKIPERRPMSTETTRSAPDVIIVSKPIR